MSKGKDQHIVPTDNGWGIKGAGNSKVTKNFDTKAEATAAGKQIAQNQNSELVIHGKDGKIQNKNSFGNDTLPPKDKKH